MPQGSGAVRPTNGLYLLPLSLITTLSFFAAKSPQYNCTSNSTFTVVLKDGNSNARLVKALLRYTVLFARFYIQGGAEPTDTFQI